MDERPGSRRRAVCYKERGGVAAVVGCEKDVCADRGEAAGHIEPARVDFDFGDLHRALRRAVALPDHVGFSIEGAKEERACHVGQVLG